MHEVTEEMPGPPYTHTYSNTHAHTRTYMSYAAGAMCAAFNLLNFALSRRGSSCVGGHFAAAVAPFQFQCERISSRPRLRPSPFTPLSIPHSLSLLLPGRAVANVATAVGHF